MEIFVINPKCDGDCIKKIKELDKYLNQDVITIISDYITCDECKQKPKRCIIL